MMFIIQYWYYFYLQKFPARCGHTTTLKGIIRAFGSARKNEIKLDESGKINMCHLCLGKCATQCPLCLRTIFPGDWVSLYSPTLLMQVSDVPQELVISANPFKIIQCRHCTDDWGECVGIWDAPGYLRDLSDVSNEEEVFH